MNLRTERFLTGCVFGACSIAAAGGAQAQGFAGRAGSHVSKLDIEPHLIAGYGFNRGPGDYGSGFGLGVRVGIPLIARGPVRSINNSLVLGVGADITYWSGHRYHETLWGTSELILPVMVQWNFYVSPWFSLFPELGVAIGIAGCAGCGSFVAPGLCLGGRVHFNGRAGYPALVFRFGFPVGFSIGVAF